MFLVVGQDTAGQELFRSLMRMYYRGARAAILCYDIVDKYSLLDVRYWIEHLRDNEPVFSIFLITTVENQDSNRKILFE